MTLQLGLNVVAVAARPIGEIHFGRGAQHEWQHLAFGKVLGLRKTHLFKVDARAPKTLELLQVRLLASALSHAGATLFQLL